MDLVLQLNLLVPQLAQLLWQMLDQEPEKKSVNESLKKCCFFNLWTLSFFGKCLIRKLT